MEGGDEGEDVVSAGVEDGAGGSNGADGGHVELGQDCGEQGRRQLIEALHCGGDFVRQGHVMRGSGGGDDDLKLQICI